MNNANSPEELAKQLRLLAEQRNWEQFHTPKNFAIALASEVGELLDFFKWLTDQQSVDIMQDPQLATRVEAELGDVVINLIRLADLLGIDPIDAGFKKLSEISGRYSIDVSYGKATKIKGK